MVIPVTLSKYKLLVDSSSVKSISIYLESDSSGVEIFPPLSLVPISSASLRRIEPADHVIITAGSSKTRFASQKEEYYPNDEIVLGFGLKRVKGAIRDVMVWVIDEKSIGLKGESCLKVNFFAKDKIFASVKIWGSEQEIGHTVPEHRKILFEETQKQEVSSEKDEDSEDGPNEDSKIETKILKKKVNLSSTTNFSYDDMENIIIEDLEDYENENEKDQRALKSDKIKNKSFLGLGSMSLYRFMKDDDVIHIEFQSEHKMECSLGELCEICAPSMGKRVEWIEEKNLVKVNIIEFD